MALNLNKLRDFKLYRNVVVDKFDQTIENKLKGQLIVHVGNSKNDFIGLLNDKTFKYNTFFNVFYPRITYSRNRRIRNLIDQRLIYKNLKEVTNRPVRGKINIDNYQGRNLMVDATHYYEIEMKSMPNKRYLNIINALEYSIERSIVGEYRNILLYFNLDSVNLDNSVNEDEEESEEIDQKGFDTFKLLRLLIRRNIGIKVPKVTKDENGEDVPLNITLMFASPKTRTFFKMPYDNELLFSKKAKIISLMKTIINRSNKFVNSEEEDITDDKISPEVEEIIDDETREGEEYKEVVNLANDKIEDLLQLTKTSDGDLNTVKSTIKGIIEKKALEKIKNKSVGMAKTDGNDDELEELEYDNKEIADDVIEDILNDEEVTEEISKAIETDKVGKHNAKFNEKLKDKQDKTLKNSLDEFKLDIHDSKKRNIRRGNMKKLNVVNPEVKSNMTINDFDKSYQENQLLEDMLNNFKAFNDDIDIPVFIDNIKIEDSSDSQTSKQTLSVKLKDEKGLSHSVTLDLPIVYDGKYMKVNGSKKIITKQLVMLPIVKTKPSEVWITTNYNKIIMERFGRKNDDVTDRINKISRNDDALKKLLAPNYSINIKKGNSTSSNSRYKVSIDYIDLSSSITEMVFSKKTSKLTSQISFEFNQRDLLDRVKKIEIDYDDSTSFPVGFISNYNGSMGDYLILSTYTDSKLSFLNLQTAEIVYDLDSNSESPKYSLSSYITMLLSLYTDKRIDKEFSTSVKSNSSLSYTRCKIINRLIPTIILLGLEDGLTTTLERADIKYELTDKNKSIKLDEEKGKIKFSDKYLIYDNKDRTNSLLLSGLNELDTTSYTFEEFNTKDPYLDYFENKFSSRNVSKGVHNALTLMVDPITKEVLKDLKQPTNISDILIYANKMMGDLSSKSFNDMSIYRIRTAEQIPAVLYQLLAESYKSYKDTSGNKSPIKVSLPKNALIKELMKTATVDESSDLNPSLELDKQGSVTYRGPSGRNSSHSYTAEVRSFDKSMNGVLSITTPDSQQVGVVREMSYNSNIKGTRGYIEGSDTTDSSSLDQLSALELLNPFTSHSADPPRIGMQAAQQKHIIPTSTNDKPLISSGVEKAVPYQVSDVFAIKAKRAGVVSKIDTRNGLLIVKYSDTGEEDVFDIAPKLNKNSTGGFFVEAKLTLLVKVGDKFDGGDILAKNDDFFTGDKQGEISYTIGTLSKIAISANANTYEDSSFITSTLSERMSSKITMKKSISLDKKSNIQFLVKEGQMIKTGQPLVVFEPEFEDTHINDILDRLGDEFAQEIEELSTKVVKSKYTGRVVKVNIYYNAELNEFSKSMRKIIEDYIKIYKDKEKAINTHIKDNSKKSITLDLPSVEKINDTKIHGEEVDGMLIEVFVEYEDKLSVGDKITFYTALKTIVSDVVPKELHPYSDLKPEEEIEAVVSPLSIVSRMVPDIYQMMFGNKVLISLKDQIKDLLK